MLWFVLHSQMGMCLWRGKGALDMPVSQQCNMWYLLHGEAAVGVPVSRLCAAVAAAARCCTACCLLLAACDACCTTKQHSTCRRAGGDATCTDSCGFSGKMLARVLDPQLPLQNSLSLLIDVAARLSPCC